MKNQLKIKCQTKQTGVVLLTCMVFLLVLLSLLRFVLSSAKLEEEKAGIDLDIVSARESAQSALKYAEYFILKQGELLCDSTVGSSCKAEAAKYANQLFSRSDAELKNVDLEYSASTSGKAVKKISDLMEKGIYTGTYIASTADQCQPLWICVKWGDAAKTVDKASTAQKAAAGIAGAGVAGGLLESIVCDECDTVNDQAKPRFIIERFTTKELKNAGLTKLETASPDTLVLRVTAVGFGKGNNGASNLTNVMLQSTYVIP